MGKHVLTILGKSYEEWAEFAKRDDCLSKMVPSDLRIIIAALRDAENARAIPAPTLGDALELPEVRAMVKIVSDAATFIVEQVETTRAYAKGSDMGASNVTLIEINTSHFLDVARILRAALAALNGGAE